MPGNRSWSYEIHQKGHQYLVSYELPKVHNSAQFLVVIVNITISPNECMISFDADSLSTGIPLDSSLETIRELLTKIPLSEATDSLMDLLNHSPINYFKFNGKFY